MHSNVIILLFFIHLVGGSEITTPDSIKGPILTYDALLGPDPAGVSGEVVMASPSVACSELDTSMNFTNKIVIVGSDRCLPQVKVEQALKVGAMAVLVEPALIARRNNHFQVLIALHKA